MTKTNTPKAAIHCQPQTAFGGAQAAENTRDWSKMQYDRKNSDPAHHYDHSRKSLNFTVGKDGIKSLSATSAATLMNRYVQRLAELNFTAYTPGAANQPISYLDIVVSGNSEVMNRLAFGSQVVDLRREADNSALTRQPEIEAWATDVYNFACRKFGEENVIGMEVHLDETTPHAHINVVPVALRQERGRERVLYKSKEDPAIVLTAKEWKNLNSSKRKDFTREVVEDGRKAKMCVSYSGLIGENRADRSKYMSNLHTEFFNEVGQKHGLFRGDPRHMLSYDEQLVQRHKTSAELENERIARCKELDEKIKQHKDALSDLKIEILVAGRKVKSFTTMIENLEKEKDSLQLQIAELKDAAAAGKISQEALKKDVEILTEKLNATVEKLGIRQEQLADTEEKLKELQDDLSAMSEKRDAAKNDFDFFSKQAVTAKNSAVERMGFIAQEIILSKITNGVSAWYRTLPDNVKEGISDTFANDFFNGANAISKTAMHLVFGMIDQAMDIAKETGGGAASPGDGWGRKDDENEREWIRRCLDMAAQMCRPGVGRSRKK